MNPKQMTDKWIWMPHAGHFILGSCCRFHLSTYVNGYIVSTVGELWNERGVREIHAGVFDRIWLTANRHLRGDYFDHAYFKRFGYEEIGCDRKYETMVFKAKKSKQKCCPYQMTTGEKDFQGYNSPEGAYLGHLKMCRKYNNKKSSLE